VYFPKTLYREKLLSQSEPDLIQFRRIVQIPIEHSGTSNLKVHNI